MTDSRSANSLLPEFARRVAALQADAWDRIAARCGTLDRRTVEAFLGRAELVGRAFVFDTDPYRQPFVQFSVGAWGTLCGIALEAVHLFHSPRDQALKGNATGFSSDDPLLPRSLADAMARVAAAAQAQRPLHPGAAAALFAVGLALLRPRPAPAMIATLYSPFEPEIPYASLRPDPEQHAA